MKIYATTTTSGTEESKKALPKLSTTTSIPSPSTSSPTYKWPSTPLHNIRLRNIQYPKANKVVTTDTRNQATTTTIAVSGESSSPSLETSRLPGNVPSFPVITQTKWSATVPYVTGAPLREYQTVRKSGGVMESTSDVPYTSSTSASSPPNNNNWKDILRPILHDFTISTPGSIIDETPNTLIWRYDNADQELALWNSKELQVYLFSQITTVIPLDIIIPPNTKAIEIHIRDASVLTGLIHILDDYITSIQPFSVSIPPLQFALCITDNVDVSGIASATLAVPYNISDIHETGPLANIASSLFNITSLMNSGMYMTRVASPTLVPLVTTHSRTGSTTTGLTTDSLISSNISRWTRGGSVEAYRTVMKQINYEISNFIEVRKLLQQLSKTMNK